MSTTATAERTPRADNSVLRPFSVHFPQEELDDLRRRLVATRWPDKETLADQSQGARLASMQELVRYWATDYDWRKAEAKLNALPQFQATDPPLQWRTRRSFGTTQTCEIRTSTAGT